MKSKIKNQKSKMARLLIIFSIILFCPFSIVHSQKYENGTRLLKGAEVMSATPLQLDYVLEKLADTAKITVNLHEGKTHLVLDDGSGKWREWWYYMGKWRLKTTDETDPTVPSHIKSITTTNISDWNTSYGWGDHSKQGYLKNYTLPRATTNTLGGVIVGSGLSMATGGILNAHASSIASSPLTPVIMGGSSTEYNLGANSFGVYWRNSRIMYMEICIEIASVSGSQTSSDILIQIPSHLSPIRDGIQPQCPTICILQHGNILTAPYTQLSGYLEGGTGIIRLTQSGYGESITVKSLEANAFIRFSIMYMQ